WWRRASWPTTLGGPLRRDARFPQAEVPWKPPESGKRPRAPASQHPGTGAPLRTAGFRQPAIKTSSKAGCAKRNHPISGQDVWASSDASSKLRGDCDENARGELV